MAGPAARDPGTERQPAGDAMRDDDEDKDEDLDEDFPSGDGTADGEAVILSRGSAREEAVGWARGRCTQRPPARSTEGS